MTFAADINECINALVAFKAAKSCRKLQVRDIIGDESQDGWPLRQQSLRCHQRNVIALWVDLMSSLY